MINNEIFGINRYEDNKEETYKYTLGKPNILPISLILSLMSAYKESPLRLLNLKASSFYIKKQKIITDNILSDKEKEIIEDKFNDGYIYELPIKKSMGSLDLSPSYKRVELWHYVDVWTELLNMATPHFEKSEGVILCCSLDYIRFRNRPEFTNPQKMIIESLESIIKEVSGIMKENKFKLSSSGYEIEVERYNPISVSEYYGF